MPGAEGKRGQLAVEQLEACGLAAVQHAAVEDEVDQVIPRPVWRDPVDAEQVAYVEVKAKLLFQLTACHQNSCGSSTSTPTDPT